MLKQILNQNQKVESPQQDSLIDTGIVSDVEMELVKEDIVIEALVDTFSALVELDKATGDNLTTGELSLLTTSTNGVLSICGLTPLTVCSGESATDMLSGEGLKEKISETFSKIKGFLKKSGKSLKEFWKKQTNVILKYTDKNNKAIERYKSFDGKPKVKEVIYPGVGSLMDGNKMSSPSRIKAEIKESEKLALLFKKLSDEVEKTDPFKTNGLTEKIEKIFSPATKTITPADSNQKIFEKGYSKVLKSENLLGNNYLLIGLAKPDWRKLTRGVFVTGPNSSAAKEKQKLLSIKEARELLSISNYLFKEAEKLKKLGTETEDKFDKAFRGEIYDKYESIGNGDVEGDYWAIDNFLTLVLGIDSLANKTIRGLYKHILDVAVASHNVAITTFNNYE